MPLTTVTDTPVKQAGNIKIAFGPRIPSLDAPSLAALTLDATCAVREVNFDMDASTTEDQSLCDVDAKTALDKRTHSLSVRFRVSKETFGLIKPQFALDAEVGMFARWFTPSLEPLAAGDEGYSWNGKVLKFLLNPVAIGNEYEAYAEFYAVEFSDSAVLVA